MGEDLRFDRAAYAPGAEAALRCHSCQNPLDGEYWQWQARVVCGTCRHQLTDLFARSRSAGVFGKAALRGGGVALACGVAYAVFVAVTKYQIAFATIGIAFVIARVVRNASGGIGGRRFQMLAVALTYVASAMGYAPGVLLSLKEAPQHEQPATKGAPTDGATTASTAEPAEKVSAGAVVLAIALLFALTLAAPILSFASAPIGMLIVVFGLWEAWKLSRGIPLTIDGPYRVAPPATGPPLAQE